MQVEKFALGISSSSLPQDGSREFLIRKTDLKIPCLEWEAHSLSGIPASYPLTWESAYTWNFLI